MEIFEQLRLALGCAPATPAVDQRAVVTSRVKDLFEQCADRPHALTHFEALLCAHGFCYLDSGLCRKVFVKDGVVVKVSFRSWSNGGDQNNIEAENSVRYPSLTPTLYAHLRSKAEGTTEDGRHYTDDGHLNILIAREVTRGTPRGYSERQRINLERTFADLHGGNIGHIDRRLVALDTGASLA